MQTWAAGRAPEVPSWSPSEGHCKGQTGASKREKLRHVLRSAPEQVLGSRRRNEGVNGHQGRLSRQAVAGRASQGLPQALVKHPLCTWRQSLQGISVSPPQRPGQGCGWGTGAPAGTSRGQQGLRSSRAAGLSAASPPSSAHLGLQSGSRVTAKSSWNPRLPSSCAGEPGLSSSLFPCRFAFKLYDIIFL